MWKRRGSIAGFVLGSAFLPLLRRLRKLLSGLRGGGKPSQQVKEKLSENGGSFDGHVKPG